MCLNIFANLTIGIRFRNMNFQNQTIAFVFFTVFAVSALAQNATVKGHLSDKKGAIAFADVFLKGENIGTTTDESGHFILNKLSPGDYIIIASSYPYERLE